MNYGNFIKVLLLVYRMVFVVSKTVRWQFENCKNLEIIDMNDMSSIQIDGQITNLLADYYICQYVVIPSHYPLIKLLASKFPQFHTKAINSGYHSKLNFVNNNNITLFTVSSDLTMDEQILFKYMAILKISWFQKFGLQFIIPPYSTVIMNLQLTNVYYCDRSLLNSKLIQCAESFNRSVICISQDLECDGVINCMSTSSDESSICDVGGLGSTGLPVIILVICIGLLILWFLFRTINCFRMSAFVTRSIYTEPPLQPEEIFVNNVDVSIVTPDNLVAPPPKYKIGNSTDVIYDVMPKSYSNENMPSVYPDFFKRFFGQPSKGTISTKEYSKSDQSIMTIAKPIPLNILPRLQ